MLYSRECGSADTDGQQVFSWTNGYMVCFMGTGGQCSGLTLNEGRKIFKQYGICNPRLNGPRGRSSGESAIPPHPASEQSIGGSYKCKYFVILKTGES